MLLAEQLADESSLIAVVTVCDSDDPLHRIRSAASKITHQLRKGGFHVWESFESTATKQLKRAPDNIKLGVFIGEAELTGGEVVVKDWVTREQRRVSISELETVLRATRTT
jgi:histidyl-tRNA synthetase